MIASEALKSQLFPDIKEIPIRILSEDKTAVVLSSINRL